MLGGVLLGKIILGALLFGMIIPGCRLGLGCTLFGWLIWIFVIGDANGIIPVIIPKLGATEGIRFGWDSWKLSPVSVSTGGGAIGCSPKLSSVSEGVVATTSGSTVGEATGCSANLSSTSEGVVSTTSGSVGLSIGVSFVGLWVAVSVADGPFDISWEALALTVGCTEIFSTGPCSEAGILTLIIFTVPR